MQDGPKAVWSIPYVVSETFFPSLKQNFIAYRSSKVSSRPECIFEIHGLWQSGFNSVYSNSCCSCSFEPEIIKIGQSSHKLYSNNIHNFQESLTILNSFTKKVWKHWICNVTHTHYIYIYIYIYILTRCSEAVVWDDKKDCDEAHWHAHTRRPPWVVTVEQVVRTVEQVNCSRRRLLRRGLKFHECNINKSSHPKKSLENYCELLVYRIFHIENIS